MMSELIGMLDFGTKRNPKLTDCNQTDLSLVPGPWTTLQLDSSLQATKLTSLGLMLGDKRPLKEETPLTSEEVVKQFSYIMTEKVKKDQLDKKAGKAKQ